MTLTVNTTCHKDVNRSIIEIHTCFTRSGENNIFTWHELSILFIYNGVCSQVNNNYQRNREHSSINLVSHVDYTISFLTNKTGHEGTQIVCTVSTYHPISQFTKTSLFLWKMIAVLLKLDDKYKPAKKTVQKQLSVTSMSAATGLWHLTGELPGAFKKSHTFS